jgi:hypothetical protein
VRFDEESARAELRALSVTEGDIDEEMERRRARAEQDAEVEVLAENWRALLVYQRCKPEIVAGAGGAMYLGISAVEIAAVCAPMRYRVTLNLVDRVQYLGHKVWEYSANKR